MKFFMHSSTKFCLAQVVAREDAQRDGLADRRSLQAPACFGSRDSGLRARPREVRRATWPRTLRRQSSPLSVPSQSGGRVFSSRMRPLRSSACTSTGSPGFGGSESPWPRASIMTMSKVGLEFLGQVRVQHRPSSEDPCAITSGRLPGAAGSPIVHANSVREDIPVAPVGRRSRRSRRD